MYDKIEVLLISRNMNKKQLAGEADIPYSSLMSAFSRKSKSVSLEMLQKIAVALGVSLDELTGMDNAQIATISEQAQRRRAFFIKYGIEEKAWKKVINGYNKFLDIAAEIGMTEEEFIAAYAEFNEMERQSIVERVDVGVIKKEGD